MADFIRVIEQFAVVLIAACLVGVAWSIRSIWVAMRERSNTLYALEREAASARVGRGVISALAFLGLGAAILFIAQYVAPSLPAVDSPTATPSGPLVTLTPSVSPFPTSTPVGTPTAEPALNLTVAAVETIETPTPGPTAIQLPPTVCPDPNVQITAPRHGDVFSGPFQVYGTANIQNFVFYKFVLNGPATNFRDQTAGEVVKTPVVNNYLGTLDDAIVSVLVETPGAYRFSLVAVNNEGNEAPHCAITLLFVLPTPAPD